jgi:ParB-like chromosome segregation protein Spo0J
MSKAKKTRGGIPIFCRFDKLVDASKLRPNPVNPYKHPKDQIDRLVAVIKANGWRNPVIVSKRSGLITKGHARHTAGLQLADTAPVEIQDYASEQKERDDLLADNQISELAERDDVLLIELLKDASSIQLTAAGFAQQEIEGLMTAFQPSQDSQSRLDQKEPVVCPKCGHPFTQ